VALGGGCRAQEGAKRGQEIGRDLSQVETHRGTQGTELKTPFVRNFTDRQCFFSFVPLVRLQVLGGLVLLYCTMPGHHQQKVGRHLHKVETHRGTQGAVGDSGRCEMALNGGTAPSFPEPLRIRTQESCTILFSVLYHTVLVLYSTVLVLYSTVTHLHKVPAQNLVVDHRERVPVPCPLSPQFPKVTLGNPRPPPMLPLLIPVLESTETVQNGSVGLCCWGVVRPEGFPVL